MYDSTERHGNQPAAVVVSSRWLVTWSVLTQLSLVLLSLLLLLLLPTGCAAADCAAGTYSDGGACKECPLGYTSEAGATKCTVCPAGSYAYKSIGSNYNDQCDPCPAGTFTAKAASVECKECALGYTSEAGATNCTLCPAGSRVSASIGSNYNDECNPCPAGTFTAKAGSDECTECALGYTSEAGATKCTVCPAGSYAYKSIGSNYNDQCDPCPAGTFTAKAASVECKECALGYTSEAGATKCILCPAGRRVSASIGSNYNDECDPCPAGTFAAKAGSVECKECALGYTSEAGATKCTVCPAGSYASKSVGSNYNDECTPCTDETSASTTGQSCNKAPGAPPDAQEGNAPSPQSQKSPNSPAPIPTLSSPQPPSPSTSTSLGSAASPVLPTPSNSSRSAASPGSAPPSSPPRSSSSSSPSLGVIVGAVVGGCLLVALVAAGAWYWRRKHRALPIAASEPAIDVHTANTLRKDGFEVPL